MSRYSLRGILSASFALFLTLTPGGLAQQLAWDQVGKFRYNIVGVNYTPGSRTVTVIFSVTNPAGGNAPYELLGAGAAAPFLPPATLRVDVAWNAGNWGSTELINTKDILSPVPRTIAAGIVTGIAPAAAASINALSSASTRRCSDAGSPCAGVPNAARTYWVASVLPAVASGAGRIGIEGHPSIQTGVDPATQSPVFASIPVTSVYRDFLIDTSAKVRRAVIDFNKCKACHDGKTHGGSVVPRLSLHGANRNEEPGVCVMCHNPNQTDAAYRTSGSEESVDFKRMVHGIHAGGIRKSPLIIIGRNGSVNDFSHVRFPGRLRNCVTCHIDANGRGTFELPLASTLGSTIDTLSQRGVTPGQIDVDPANDLRISPIAATCSACHDDSEARRHMVRMGAQFGVVQSVIPGKEQCVTCHGPGRREDVRRAHEIGSSGSSSGGDDGDHREKEDRKR